MTQPVGPGTPGQPPPGPPDWRQPPQQRVPPQGWQQPPAQPVPPPAAPAPASWQQPPAAPAPASWQQPPQQPMPPPPPAQAAGQQPPAQPVAPPSWQQPPRQPVPPAAPPPPPPSWTSGLTSTTPAPVPAGFVYADVPNRTVAYIIDMIVLGIIGILVSVVVGGFFGGLTTTATTTNAGSIDINYVAFGVVAIVDCIVGAAYFVWMWSAQRATVGMRVLGLQIGNETDGRTITASQAFTRWLIIGIPSILAQFAGYVSTGVSTLLGLVGLIWLIALLVSIARSPTKQGYHDRYAHTIMVKAARRAT